MNPELVDANTLHARSDLIEMRGLLPHLVRRLVSRTPGVSGVVMPAEEGIAAHGYDGRISDALGNAWVPAGPSAWEMGASLNPRGKAQKDYDTRTKMPGPVEPSETTFVFVTSRRWADGQNWAEERSRDAAWRDVRVLDAEALYAWLEDTPDVHVWLSEGMGLRPLRVRTLSRAYEQLAARTEPPLPMALLLAGRQALSNQFTTQAAARSTVTAVRASSRDEALAFIAARLDSRQEDEADHPLVGRDSESLERLAMSETPLTLVVANPEDAEIGDAVSRGHGVILALGAGDFAGGDTIELPRPDRTQAREAFVQAGVGFEAADRLAGLARRSFAALLREIAVTPGGMRPSWAASEDAPALTALLLVGGWTPADGDQEAVAAVTGLSGPEIETILLRYVGSDDSPWARSAGSWQLVSPDDSWTLLHDRLTEQLLQRWQEQLVSVLIEFDPQLGFDSAQRLLAEVRGDDRARYSRSLRHGLAEAAALVGVRGGHASPAGLLPSHFATAGVTRILDQANADGTGALWSSLSRQLPLLAEAAPDAFLDAVAVGLSRDASPILAMFTDGPGSSALMSPSSPHTGLLWALEGLAWSPPLLVRATLLLGELAEHEPGGRGGNRPSRSLRPIFLPWHPQTSATPEQRLEALDALRMRWAEAAWELELGLLPRHQDSSSPSHRPRFADWVADDQPVPADAELEHIDALSERAGLDADESPRRWMKLIPALSRLPGQSRDALLDRLVALAETDVARDDRIAIWRALLDEADHHLSFPDAQWSLGSPYAERLSALAKLFEELDAPEGRARLFDHSVVIPDVPRIDFEAHRNAVDEARRTAAHEVYEHGGLPALMRLAAASNLPRAVGVAHAQAESDEESEALLGHLGEAGSAAAMAAGWVAARYHDAGEEWVRLRTPQLPALSIDGQAAFLLELPATQSTWELADSLAPETQRLYWRGVRPFGLAREDLAGGVERLLTAGRPWTAIEVLSASLHDGGEIDIELADRVLTAAAESGEIDATGSIAYEVGQILDAMECAGAALPRLARQEFAFFVVLDHERAPRALSAGVAIDQTFFVDLVRLAHRSVEKEPEASLDGSWHAGRVLDALETIPGTGDDGIDAAALDTWVTQTRVLLDTAGLSEVGDFRIGKLLARSAPDPDDGIWPAAAVRDVLESKRSEHLEAGLRDGHISARGVTTRGVYTGGQMELDLAQRLKDGAAVLDVRCQRTARLLRGLAATYDGFADMHNRQAQRLSDED